MAKWVRDRGYDCCKTARFGSIAVVICPPEYSGDGSWGYQAFDESDWQTVASGECEYEGYGFKSEEEVVRYVEDCME